MNNKPECLSSLQFILKESGPKVMAECISCPKDLMP